MSSTGWEVRFSNSKRLPYFYNAGTGQSVWEPPAELSADDVKRLPGAEKYLSGGAGGGAGEGGGGGAGAKEGQARASHILVKHAGSRRPSSWKEDKITRPLAAARQQIEAHIAHLESVPAAERPKVFAEIAASESDCSSARKGGDLGWFGRGMMQKSFEDATFALQPGEMSGVVESDSGVHVILRTG